PPPGDTPVPPPRGKAGKSPQGPLLLLGRGGAAPPPPPPAPAPLVVGSPPPTAAGPPQGAPPPAVRSAPPRTQRTTSFPPTYGEGVCPKCAADCKPVAAGEQTDSGQTMCRRNLLPCVVFLDAC